MVTNPANGQARSVSWLEDSLCLPLGPRWAQLGLSTFHYQGLWQTFSPEKDTGHSQGTQTTHDRQGNHLWPRHILNSESPMSLAYMLNSTIPEQVPPKLSRPKEISSHVVLFTRLKPEEGSQRKGMLGLFSENKIHHQPTLHGVSE